MIKKQPDSFYQAPFAIRSPLAIACSKDGSMDVVKFLVEEYGLDPLEGAEVIGLDDTEKYYDYWIQ